MITLRWLGLVGVFCLTASACAGSSDGNMGYAGGAGMTSDGGGSNGTGGGSTGGHSTGGGPTGGSSSSGTGKAANVAKKLGLTTHFLIGMGNDGNDGFSRLGVTMDMHYMYLTPGWTGWNPNGAFADIVIDASTQHGAVPMFSYYGMEGWGDGNIWAMQDSGYMTNYWSETELLFQHIANKGGPAIVHLEPDFWEYVRNQSGGDTSFAAKVKVNSRCSDLPDSVAGMGKCLVRVARQVAPKTLIGFHASAWAGWGSGGDVGNFLKGIGAGDADVIIVETLDRDAGCFEARDANNNCTRDPSGMYWSDSDFSGHLGWVKTVSSTLGLPAMWWQTPFGVPSSTPGGSPGHYRDNRVKYFFSHVPQLVSANGVGAAFGVGAGGQTYIDTDNGQFKNAVNAYFKAPTPLP